MSVTWLMYFLWLASSFVVVTTVTKALGVQHPLAAGRSTVPARQGR